MKQLIIGQKKAYAAGVTYASINSVPEGTLAIFTLSDGALVSTKAGLTGNFAVVCGRGTNKAPIHFPEVDIKTLTVEKATYTAGTTFTGKITVPAPEKGKHYTVIIAKHGVVFHERNRWTFTSMAKSTTAADVAKDIVAQVNANKHTSGVGATYTGGAITFTAIEAGTDYSIIGADELTGVTPTDVTHGAPAMLDKAYVEDLASRCAAGKGFNYTDNPEIYPGYPEKVDESQYVMYSLRFAVPRVAAKQRDEVVYQILHIVVPVGSGAITTLDTIFGTAAPTQGTGGAGQGNG